MSDPALGMPTRPKSTERPSTARWGGAGSDSPHPASAPVSPTARTPAATSAATNRVLTAPASTATTISSVASSVIRRPSTCRFSMPAALSAASISLPPPWTIDQRHALLRRPGDGRDDRRQPRPIFEQLAAELQNDEADTMSTSKRFTTKDTKDTKEVTFSEEPSVLGSSVSSVVSGLLRPCSFVVVDRLAHFTTVRCARRGPASRSCSGRPARTRLSAGCRSPTRG